MLKGNKGEWSEVYTLLKILSDRALFAGDEDLNQIEKLIFPIIKVLRSESNGTFDFGYEDDLVIVNGGGEEFRIPINEFRTQASLLLAEIKSASTSSFSIPATEEFINSFNCHSLKASSSVKSDICIVIHDRRTGTCPELGFSIKSQLGNPSTLLNAGKTTNFVYSIDGLANDQNLIDSINSTEGRSKIKDRIGKIQENSGILNFSHTEKNIFGNNLTLIDSSLPAILAEMVYYFFTSPLSKTKDLAEILEKENPLRFDLSCGHPYYRYKIKRFLTDIALGMMPGKVWNGTYDATGGYLIVKEDGDILCYHIYNKNEFEDYLFNNTKFDTASSKRHQFGYVYNDNGELKINLNLQIRFAK